MKTFVWLFLFPASLAWADAWDDVLKQARLTKDDVHVSEPEYIQSGGAEAQGGFALALTKDPLRAPAYARLYRAAVFEKRDKLFEILIGSLSRVGIAVRRGVGDSNPFPREDQLSKHPEGLKMALETLAKKTGAPVRAGDLRGLDVNLQQVLAYLIFVQARAYEWRQKAFADVEPALLKMAYRERMLAPKSEGESAEEGVPRYLRKLLKQVDLKFLMAGGVELMYALEKAKVRLADVKSWPKRPVEIVTGIGKIVVAGDGQKNVHKGGAFLLLIDPNGDDTYVGTAGGAADLAHPIALILDLDGDDKYVADEKLLTAEPWTLIERKAKITAPAQGSGFFGYGLLLDMKGNDLYRAYRLSQARGDFGIGVLWDVSGDDRYECWTQCQASGEFGAGFLLDGGGRDQYSSFLQSQAFGGPIGAATLLDFGNDQDRYLANDTQIDFPSLVDKKHNTSMAQAMACGIRGDFIDGYSMSAGYAGLIDEGGDNTFSAGLFAQGANYWYGAAVLSVGAGNDKYSAVKYSQGAATHMGVSVLHDLGGDDHYTVQQELGQGHGHDFGTAFFLDESGNDTYNAPNFSLGCASAQGVGIFWDKDGDDKYSSKEKETIGCASLRTDAFTSRAVARTLGIFLDTGGSNRFDTPKFTGKKSSGKWRSPVVALEPKSIARLNEELIGVGLITDSPKTPDPRP